MYNFIKRLFGISDDHPQQPETSNNECSLRDQFLNSGCSDGCNIEPTDEMESPSERIFWRFSSPIFMNPFQIEKDFEKIFEEMERKFSMFGFDNFPSISFDDGESSRMQFFNRPEEVPSKGNLRDFYLKRPGIDFNENEKRDIILDGQITADEIKDLMENKNQGIVSEPPDKGRFSCTFQSVTLKIKPDKSIEIVQQVRDNTGKDETYVTNIKPSE